MVGETDRIRVGAPGHHAWVTFTDRAPIAAVSVLSAPVSLTSVVVNVTVSLPATSVELAATQSMFSVTSYQQRSSSNKYTDALRPTAPPSRTDTGRMTLGGSAHVTPAAWRTVTLVSPTVIAPERVPPVFASTSIVKLPGDAEEGALIQGSLTVTVQLVPQLAPPDTATDSLPPEAGKLNDVGVTVGGEPEPACVQRSCLRSSPFRIGRTPCSR